ncbi:MAG: hypothetical protein U1E65_34470 [Myxococcota bacterium]
MRTQPAVAARRWKFGAALIALSASACSESAGVESTRDPLEIYPIELGQGIILEPNPVFSVARGPCVDFLVQTDQLLETQAVAISATSERDLADQLSVALGGEMPIKGVKTSLNASFEGRWSEKGGTENVALIARVKSVRQRAVRSNGSESNLCRNKVGQTIDSVDRFLTECGEVWNDREDRGGTFVITWDTARMTKQETDDLKVKLGVGNSPETGTGSLVGRLTRLSTTSQTFSQIRVDVIGYPALGKTDIPGFLTYLGTLTHDISSAYARGATKDPSYGTVLEQSFRPYTTADLSVCTKMPPLDADKIMECTSENQLYTTNLSASDTPLEAQVELVNAWFGEVQAGTKLWPAPERENRTAAEDWLKSVDECRARASNTAKDCRQHRDDWSAAAKNATPLPDPADVCAACVFPEGCEPDVLAAVGRGLPAPVAAPFRGQPRSLHDHYVVRQGDPPVDLGPVKERVCVLSGVYGALRGGGESARVEVMNDEYWLVYDTQRTALTERGFAHALCVDGLHFDNGTRGIPSLYPPIGGECSVGPFPQAGLQSTTCTIPATGGFLSIGGLKGRFDDEPQANTALADFVRVERVPSRNATGEVRVSQYGDSLVDLIWTASGVELTSRTAPALLFNQPVTQSFQTGSRHAGLLGVAASEGLCYFTGLGGDFWSASDGANIEEINGEWALVVQSGCKDAIANIFPSCTRRLIEATVQCVKFDQR